MICESVEHVPDSPNIHSVLNSPLCLSATAPALPRNHCLDGSQCHFLKNCDVLQVFQVFGHLLIIPICYCVFLLPICNSGSSSYQSVAQSEDHFDYRNNKK